MAGFRIFRRISELLDVLLSSPQDGDVLAYDAGSSKWVNSASAGGGGAPTDVDYLVGTASGGLSAEIVVGTSPGGELGGTWASPTVDATHSGSSHASVQAAAEATAAAALAAHESDTTSVHGIADTSTLYRSGGSDVALADGGTGASLADPDADRMLFWDDSLGAVTFLAPDDSTVEINGTTIRAKDGGITSAKIADGTIVNADINASAAIAYSKLNLAGSVTTGDLAFDPATQTELDAHLNDTTDAHDASAISSVAAGNLSSTDVQAALNELDTEKQPLDSDLTAIAALSPTNDDVVQRKAGAWTNRSIAQLLVDLAAAGTTFQPLDSDLTALAGLAIAADTLPYGSGSHTMALATFTAFARSLLDDADAATARGTLAAAPVAAKYIVQTADSELSAEQALGALATGLLKNTTTTGVLSIAAEGTDYYKPGGTDVALADGGTGASLTDPNADRIMFWDDSAGSVTWLTAGTNLTITGTTIDATAGSGTSPDDVSLIVHMEEFA